MYRFSVVGVSNIERTINLVLSNMDVSASSCEGLGSESFWLIWSCGKNQKPRVKFEICASKPRTQPMQYAPCALADTSAVVVLVRRPRRIGTGMLSPYAVYVLDQGPVSIIQSMGGPVLSNMDVSTSSCQRLCSYPPPLPYWLSVARAHPQVAPLPVVAARQ